MLAAAVLFVAVSALNLTWLLKSGLPRHPVSATPSAPPAGTTQAQRMNYLVDLDRYDIARGDRQYTINTAIGIEVLAFLVLAASGLAAHFRIHFKRC